MNNERNSEMKMLWTIIAILGSQLLGINIGEMLSLLNLISGGSLIDTGTVLPAIQTSQTAASNGSPLAMVAVVGAYAWSRYKIKLKRLEVEQSKGGGQ